MLAISLAWTINGENGATIFKIATGTNAFTTLATFNGYGVGDGTEATLIADAAGNLYGTGVLEARCLRTAVMGPFSKWMRDD